ncbi:MAG TPA: type VI secretion system accessory protein TagJ [Blastocatellia bacterium]|nr:type VI secretion system accessory protein TagJ [Blastocatellia bacterium]
MATAKDKLDAGDLRSAIEDITREVRSSPGDTQRRTFLFELLCFAGDFDRAQKQLDVIASQSANAEAGVQVYRNNIAAERSRQRLFSDGVAPHFLEDPPAYVDLHLEAINRLREGNAAEARRLLDQAEEDRPAMPGKLNGQQFDDFRDYNDIIAPVLELFVQDKYSWLPFEQIKLIEIEAPKRLRDLIWPTARIETTGGTVGELHVPALYAGSHEHDDDLVRLGRKTDWKAVSDELYVAAGLRLFWVGGEEKPFLGVRSVEFGGG